MAGSSTSLSVGTAPMSSTEASIWASTPSRLRRRMCQCSASCGVMSAVGSATSASSSPDLDSKCSMKCWSASSDAVEHEVVGELALLVGDLAVGRDVVRVDHREVEPGLHAVVEEDGVEHRAGGHADAERDVGDAERGLDAGELRLDQPDALDRLDRGRLPLVVAGGEREGQRVEDQRLGLEAVLVAHQLLDAAWRSRACGRASWPCRPRRWSARSARRRGPWRSGRPCRACRGRPRG